jgi:hypothetical protein
MLTKIVKDVLPYIAAGVMAISTVGCDETKTVKSQVLHEDGRVLALIYTPSRHDVQIRDRDGLDSDYQSADNTLDTKLGQNNYYGNNANKQTEFNAGDKHVTISEVPEKFGAVFQCTHGSFTITGSAEKYRALYDKLHENQPVDITYQEIYRETWSDKNENDIRDEGEVTRVITGYDFLDANSK